MFGHFSEMLTKARSNKSANKPDTELNEFESVGRFFLGCFALLKWDVDSGRT